MVQINPDKETKHGWHVDKYWPGLIHSVWSLKFVELRRERHYAERQNQTLKTEAWLLIMRVGRHRIGYKWERDL